MLAPWSGKTYEVVQAYQKIVDMLADLDKVEQPEFSQGAFKDKKELTTELMLKYTASVKACEAELMLAHQAAKDELKAAKVRLLLLFAADMAGILKKTQASADVLTKAVGDGSHAWHSSFDGTSFEELLVVAQEAKLCDMKPAEVEMHNNRLAQALMQANQIRDVYIAAEPDMP